MGLNKSPGQLAKFFVYVLGRAPDEFGLVPDGDGFFKIKDFLKAVWEEAGFRFVRQSHINEILLTISDPPLEVKDKMIRAADRQHLPRIVPASDPPKLLYTCVRKRAHPSAMEKGIKPMGYSHVILCASKEMAERIGGRIDQSPVLLTVQVKMALDSRVVFFSFGENMFLADEIPVGCFSGPPILKELVLEKKPPASKIVEMKTPGTFKLDIFPEKAKKKKGQGKRNKDIAWKKERRRNRKNSEKW